MTAPRAATPFDVSDSTIYVEDSWREPFARLRAEMPVSWRGESPYGAYWSVASHGLIQDIELDWETFSSEPDISIADGNGSQDFPNFLSMDPPRHTEIRRVFAEAFTPSQMARRKAEIQARTRALLDELPIGESFDWVERVSVPLTIGMLAILFDFPWDKRYNLKEWSDMASNFSPEIMTEEYSQKFMAEMMKMMVQFDELLDARRTAEPGDDLLSRMVHSPATAELNPMERLANIVVLIVGGNDTTRNSMSALVEVLDRWPGELDKLRADPSLIPNAAQELIRWQSPVSHMRRTATRDTELGGQTISKGDKVVLWYISGNRDESVFPDAERFDVTRDNARRHVSFGHGVHRCVGARLAEMQLAILIEEIVARRLRIVPQGAPTRMSSPFLHAFTAMPVKLVQD